MEICILRLFNFSANLFKTIHIYSNKLSIVRNIRAIEKSPVDGVEKVGEIGWWF